MNGTEFNDDDYAPIPLWAKDYPKTWLTYIVVDHILWLEHEASDIQRIFQESKMFFKDHTLLEDPLSKGFPIPGLLKQIRERARVGDLLGPSYYQVQLTSCSQTLMCDVCCYRIEKRIDRHTSVWISPFTQDLRCTACVAVHGEPSIRYPSQSRELAWNTTMSSNRQLDPFIVWKINNVRSWMKFIVIEHLLWKLKAAEICTVFYNCPQMLNNMTDSGFNKKCLDRTGQSLGQLMYEYGHKNSLGEPVFNVQIPNLMKLFSDPLRCDRCFEALKGPSVAMEVHYLRLYCSECFPLTRLLPMISETSGVKSQAVELSTNAIQQWYDKAVQQIDQDRILAETLQKEFDESEAAPPPPTPSPLPRPLLAAPSPNPGPSPASISHGLSKSDFRSQLQSTVVRSGTLIDGTLAGERWFAFKMYEHASRVGSPNMTERELNEAWESLCFDTRLRLVCMRDIHELLRRASVQLATSLRVEPRLRKWQQWILIQNQTTYARCSQKSCIRGRFLAFSIGELIYVSVVDLETVCFLCGPQYIDGLTIIYHPSRLLPRILAEALQKGFNDSEAAPASPTPSPLPRPLLAAPSPNPSPSPASDDNQAALKKLTQKATKRDVHCQLQSTVSRSETLITGTLAGKSWFAFKMYEHASLALSPNVTEQKLNEDWNSWPFNTRSLACMGTIQKLLQRAWIQLTTTLRVKDQLHIFQHWIIIQNQTTYAKCSQKGCTRGLFSIGELIYVSAVDLETLCFLCGPQYTDGQTIIYHPSRLLPSKPQQQPEIQQSLARLAIQDDNSSLSAPKRQKSSEGDETESNTNPRDKAVDSEPDNSTCVICLEEKAAWASIPCGHMHYCGDCIKLIKNCASCRASIQLRVRIYNS